MNGRLALWALAAVLTVAVVGLSFHFVDPFPPTRITLATGQPGGAYDDFGREYQRRLAREGLRVDLRGTAGSVENWSVCCAARWTWPSCRAARTRSRRTWTAGCGGWPRSTGSRSGSSTGER